MVAFLLLVVGGLNWGLIGLGYLVGGASWNLVNIIFGSWPVVENLVYVLVGLSAVWIAATHKKDCRTCCATSGAGEM